MISKEFQENIESGDVMLVRSALLDDLIIDRTFKTFDEDYKAASEKLNLLVPYDEEPFETNSEKWDKKYLNQQKVALMVNFSEERINHLKAVIEKVMPPVTEKKDNTTLSYQTPHGSKARRTGRTVVREVEKNKEKLDKPHDAITNKTNTASDSESGRTGRKKIKERVINKEKSSKKKSEIDMAGNALIIGGIATTTAGIALAQPVVAGTGVIATGAGVCIKVYNWR